MKPVLSIQALLAVAFVATAVFSSAVSAQTTSPATNKADPKQTMPARDDMKPGAAPTVQNIGDNAKRQHDPKAAAANKAGTAAAAAATPATTGDEVRDWARIDSNKDNLISPDEMEKYLTDSRSAAPAKAAEPAKK